MQLANEGSNHNHLHVCHMLHGSGIDANSSIHYDIIIFSVPRYFTDSMFNLHKCAKATISQVQTT